MITVITDLDGTLLHHGQLPPESIEALIQFQKQGRLLLATGRSLESVEPFYRLLKMEELRTGGLIAINGLETFDFQDGEHRVANSICSQDIPTILQTVQLFTRRVRIVRTERYIQKVEMMVPVFSSLIVRYFRKKLPEYTVLQIGRHWVEILPKGTDKLNGLQYFSQKYHFSPKDVYAFGDGENDVQMLRWAGHSYAPQNALAVAKRAAKGFCAPCQQQGVSQIVNELIKKGQSL